MNLRTGICSGQFQKRLLEEHESLKFHSMILRNLYVKCDTNEVVFIFEPDWGSKYVFGVVSIIDSNNRFLENYLYDNIITEIIKIGIYCNKGLNASKDKIKLDISKLNLPPLMSLPVAFPINSSEKNIYLCPHHGCRMEFGVRKGHFTHCPICDNPIALIGTGLKIIREEDLSDGNK